MQQTSNRKQKAGDLSEVPRSALFVTHSRNLIWPPQVRIPTPCPSLTDCDSFSGFAWLGLDFSICEMWTNWDLVTSNSNIQWENAFKSPRAMSAQHASTICRYYWESSRLYIKIGSATSLCRPPLWPSEHQSPISCSRVWWTGIPDMSRGQKPRALEEHG